MQALESTTFSLDADIRVRNIPDAPFEELNLTLSGEGSLAANVTSFMNMQPEDFLDDSMAVFPLVADALRAVAADMTFTLEIPEEFNALLHEDEPRLPGSVSLDLRMVDGVMYANLAGIKAAAPGATIPAGWVGLDVALLYDTLLPDMLENMPSAATFDLVPVMTSLMQPENLGQFVTVERLPDTEVNEQTMAVFETRLDYVAMLEIREFREVLLATVEEDEADEALESIRAMYEGLTLVITQHISLEDKLVHRTEVQMDWDLSTFAEMSDEESLPQFFFNVVVTEESFNDAPEVVAPEDAMLFPVQQLFPASTPSN
jgi:hypothetical protein